MFNKVTMKAIAVATIFCFVLVFGVGDCICAAQAAPANPPAAGSEKVAKDTGEQPKSVEQETNAGTVEAGNPPAKKQSFPWLLVIGGAVVVGLVIYFLLLKKTEYTLTVNVALGASGTPATGQTKYKKGDSVAYHYTLQSGYKDLAVKLDDRVVTATGMVNMDNNHILAVSATQLSNYTLTATRGTGVDGTPATGAVSYVEGTTATWSYTVQPNYENLVVLLDGVATTPSGSVVMNGNHTLTATATLKNYTLTVTIDAYITGTPAETASYPAGSEVNYSYALMPGNGNVSIPIPTVIVTIDGVAAPASGTIVMNDNHAIVVRAPLFGVKK